MSFREFRGAAPARITCEPSDGVQPVRYRCEGGRVDSAGWLREHAAVLEHDLDTVGAVLLRGFGIDAPEKLDSALRVLYGEPMSYRENTSLRTPLYGGVKTSTDHPADQWIEQHSEQSYSRHYPLRLMMCCARTADLGGATPVADTRRILARLPEALVKRLSEDGYMYRCRFRPAIRPHWRETYQIDEREALERHFAWAGIEWQWESDDELTTLIRRPAIVAHPRTGQAVWFNHILFWHYSSLEPWLAAELLQQFGHAGLPHSVYHGDGTPFSATEIDAIRAAHRAETWALQWERGDLLIVDNLLRTHGRASYAGPRQVMFAMALPVDAGGAGAQRIL